MLIPRFSIRWLLGLTTLCAGVSLVLSYAVRGQSWAIGILIGLGSLLVVGVLYIAAFGIAWFVWRSMGTLHEVPPGDSPFAKSAGSELSNGPITENPAITG
jgi:hypothetical protein